jgi:hypothetical protein
MQRTHGSQASNPVTRLFALLRAFEQAKKMQFDELILYRQAGKITRYEIEKSLSTKAHSSRTSTCSRLGRRHGRFRDNRDITEVKLAKQIQLTPLSQGNQ